MYTGGDWTTGSATKEKQMNWLRVRAALLSSVVLASSAAFVRADCGCAAPAAPCATPCAPAMRTVTVQEWVPEKYETCRTVYKEECTQEKYTAYRTECVAEQRTQQVTVYKSVCETHNETRCITKCVPVCEQRTVNKRVVTCVPETTYTHRCVDKGHWECEEVACGESFFERMGKLCGKHKGCGCDTGCNSGCNSGCGCETACEAPRTKTVRKWVSCKVEECVPCTKMVRHVECVPTVENVTCYKHVQEQITVPVSCFKCVPECVTRTCTVMVPHQVAYEACRTVKHCVPVQEKVTCCRMVCHTCEKQVPCEAAATTCGCENTCCEHGHRGFKLSGLFGGHHNECGCESSCGCH
jgi:hypothetical protein